MQAIVRVAAHACGTPWAWLGFVDESVVWVAAAVGPVLRAVPRSASLSDLAVVSGRPVVMGDVRTVPAVSSHRLVVEDDMVAFAAVPITGRDGLAVGALCVADVRPRRFREAQIDRLSTLAAAVAEHLDLRRVGTTQGRLPHPAIGADPVRLRAALDEGEFLPYFQPIVDLADGRVRSLEALLRWHHPHMGVLPAGAFVSAVEGSSLVLPVGRFVLDQSLRLLTRLACTDIGYVGGLSVNVSPKELAVPGFAGAMLETLVTHEIPPAAITVEILENGPLAQDRSALRELDQLREAGVAVAVDDYGAGHSNLLRLLDLPIDRLKLDRRLIARLPDDKRSLAAVRSTLNLAQDLGLDVVAEGIETESQRDLLLELGCRDGQGFLFSPALAPSAVRAYLTSHPGPLPVRWTSYPESPGLAHDVAHFLHGEVPDPILVVATPGHRAPIRKALADTGTDVRRGRAGGTYVEIDADAALRRLVPGGRVDRTAFEREIASPVRHLAAVGGEVRVYGELAGLLWERGQTREAAQLEYLWNDLALHEPLARMYGFPDHALRES